MRKRYISGEKKKIIVDYIKKNPKTGGHTLMKETKINFQTIFPTIKDAYKAAGVQYPRRTDKRNRKEKMDLILEEIRKNPLITTLELGKKLNLSPYKYFKNLKEIYYKANIDQKYINKKRKIKKQKEIIQFIRAHPFATQREINIACKTHVQDHFEKGIFEAYEKAKIKFPFERLKLYGVGLKHIRDRAKTFEDEVSLNLSGLGSVHRLIKTKRGIADIIFERKGKKSIIEVKDYQNKEISKSQINQLNKYLEDCECDLGFLICRKKPKKDKFLIGRNKIIILEFMEIPELCKIMDA